MSRFPSIDTFGFILLVSVGETIVSGIIMIGQSSLYWALLLPIEFVVLVLVGIWIMGWSR